ncbi:unnamed protein product [Clonostachys byssicola]|uniref:Uncharacterized protein n=1 Tax=Clonostachys byssicola TaxID=160290 RepID=A0A9N9YBU9_9HYPO|nr:unnamed protein product [Clonostachys byssicola]
MADSQPVSGEAVTPTTGADVPGAGEHTDGNHNNEEIAEGDGGGRPSRETAFLTVGEQQRQTKVVADQEYFIRDLLAARAMLHPAVPCPHQGCDHVVANNDAVHLVDHIRHAHEESLTNTVRCPLQGCDDEAVYNSLPELACHILMAHQRRTVLPSFSELSQSLSSPEQSLSDPSPAPVGENPESPPAAQLPSPQSQLQQNQPLPQHTSPRVEFNPNPTAQAPNPTARAPRTYGLYSRDRTEQVREQTEQRTRYRDPRLTAAQPQLQEQPQVQEQPQLQEQPQSQITDDDRQAALLLAAMSGGQFPARKAAEDREPTPYSESEEETQSEGQGDALEAGARPDEPTTVTDPPFEPVACDHCSMCLRSLPNPQTKAPEDEPPFEDQWQAHVDPERNCRIPNKLGNRENIPNRSGWLRNTPKDRIINARKDYRNKNKDLFGHKFYPFEGKQPNSSLWKYDPNNKANRQNWNKPWPPEIEKRLREDAAREAEARTEAPGPSRAAARARPTATRRRKRQAPSDNAGYRTESESDSDDDLEPDVDDISPPKRRRVARLLPEEIPELEAGPEIKLEGEPEPQEQEPQLLVAEVQEETEQQVPPPRRLLLLQGASGGLLGNARKGDSRGGRFDFTVVIVCCFGSFIDRKIA